MEFYLGTTTKTVDVPKVRVVVEEEEVEVPYIDVDFPGEESTEERKRQTVTVRLDVPAQSYDVAIEEVYLVDEEIWVLSALERSGTAGVASEKRASDTVVINAPEVEVKHYIIGQEVDADEGYNFIDSKNEIAEQLQSGALLYQAS